MTRPSEGTYTTSDGLQLRILTWLPEEGAKINGVVVIAHGLGEHAGRYEHVADALTAAGFAVRALDHRGHGRSGGLRGHVDEFAQLPRDLAAVVQAFRAEHPGLPAVVMGHSLGGLVTLQFHINHPDHGLDGLILSNPLLAVAFVPPRWKTMAARLLGRIAPRLRLDNELDTSEISRDPAEVKAYEDDPLVHRLISTRLFNEMMAAAARTPASASSFRLPTLWVLGGSDKIVSAKAGEAFARTLPADATTIRVWPESYHEPHNDLDKAEVIEAIVGWVQERTAASS